MTAPEVVGGDWLRRFHPSSAARHRLVCFPHAGGAASTYHRLSANLTPGTEVLSVQYPGRHDRYTDPLIDTIEILADRAYDALRARTDARRKAGGPAARLSLFGHSMGAVIAFEVARRLEAEGDDAALPTHLFVSGRRAPSRYREERAHLLDDDGLAEVINTLGGTETAVLNDPDLRKMVMPVVRNDYRAIETYDCPPDAVLAHTPITALVGDADSRASVDEVEAWRDHTKARFGFRVFAGGGHFYLAESHAEVAAVVETALETAS